MTRKKIFSYLLSTVDCCMDAEIIKSVFTIIFRPKIIDVRISDSFLLDNDEFFVIKIQPIKDPFIVISNEKISHPNIIKDDILSILTSRLVKTEIYKKHRFNIKSITSSIPLLIFSLENSKVITKLSIVEEIFSPLLSENNTDTIYKKILKKDFKGNVSILRDSMEGIDLRKIIDTVFFKLSGIPWKLDDFFYIIDKVSLQFLLSKVISHSTEDEISTLVFTLKKSGERIKNNMSSRAWNKIELMVKEKEATLAGDPDWVKSVNFVMSVKINRILREEGKNTPLSHKLEEIRKNIENIFYHYRTSKRVISNLIYLLNEKRALSQILNYIDRTTLAKALVGIDDTTIDLFGNILSEKGKKMLIEDINFFSSSNFGFLIEKFNFVSSAIKTLLELEKRVKKTEEIIKTMMSEIDYLKCYYSTNLSGIVSLLIFVKTLKEKDKELFNEFMSKIEGSMNTVVKLFLSGRLGFPFAYGDTLINEKYNEFLEKLYFSVKFDEILK